MEMGRWGCGDGEIRRWGDGAWDEGERSYCYLYFSYDEFLLPENNVPGR
jgi:hypothetical protein